LHSEQARKLVAPCEEATAISVLYARPPPFARGESAPAVTRPPKSCTNHSDFFFHAQCVHVSSPFATLVEGNSIRSTERMTGIHRDTIMRLLLAVGDRCGQILNERMRKLPCRIVQVDEIWTYVGKKERHLTDEDNPLEVGDQYVFVAMDSETKIVPSFRIGKRNAANTWYFMQDLEQRFAYRVQLTTDGFRPYINAVEDAFGVNVDYAMLVKLYGKDESEPYAPAQIVQSLPIPVMGDPKPGLISTSHIERQNLTMRMQLRRFTRLTNAFSKKLANLKAACALHFAHYNFCRVHQTLRVTPAMAAGVVSEIWPLSALLL
jgi:IS1 family transposase